VLTDFENSSTVANSSELSINKIYFPPPLKTTLHRRVIHISLKSIAFALLILDDKAVPNFYYDNFVN